MYAPIIFSPLTLTVVSCTLLMVARYQLPSSDLAQTYWPLWSCCGVGQGGGANGGERELQTRSIASSIALRLSVVDESEERDGGWRGREGNYTMSCMIVDKKSTNLVKHDHTLYHLLIDMSHTQSKWSALVTQWHQIYKQVLSTVLEEEREKGSVHEASPQCPLHLH